MGDLARQDEYTPTPDVDWSRYNQPMGELKDPNPVAYNTAAGPIYQSDVDRAHDLGMSFSGGGLGIRAYHSSPHDFERFDMSKIGTGEGAQVYGHGLYFAENPDISGKGGHYYNQFSRQILRDPGPEGSAFYGLQQAGGDRAKAVESATVARDRLAEMARYSTGDANAFAQQKLQNAQARLDLLQSDKILGPKTYEVNINADPSTFLNWDRSLPQQSPFVQSIIEPMISARAGKDWYQDFGRTHQGSDFYRNYSASPSRMSAELNEAGIPGIKYLDQGSRGSSLAQMPKPTSNYVVFNDKLIDILRKYGIAGAAALPAMGELARQDNYPQGD
jgi:hypothetical protein